MDMLANLILDELKLIRKDMKEEIRKLRCSMLKTSNISVDVSNEDELNKNENSVGYFNNTSNDSLNGNSVEVSGICERVFVKQEAITEETFQHHPSSNFDFSRQLPIANNNNVSTTASNIEINNDNEISTRFYGVAESVSGVPDADVFKGMESTFENDKFNQTTSVSCANHNPIYDCQQSNINVVSDKDIPDHYGLCMISSANETSSDEDFRVYQKTKELSLWKSDQNNCLSISKRENSFPCELCGKNFPRKASFKRHMTIHARNKPYACDICGKSFNERGTLKVHKRVHNGEKPYDCDICGKSFRHSATLTGHKRVHTGEKPFNCNVCGRPFARKGNLRSHKRLHTENKNTCVKFVMHSSQG